MSAQIKKVIKLTKQSGELKDRQRERTPIFSPEREKWGR